MHSLLGPDYALPDGGNGESENEEEKTSVSTFTDYALNLISKSKNQPSQALIVLPRRADDSSYKPHGAKDILANVSPAEAQNLAPIFGPLRPDQDKKGGLYRNFRNHAMGHLLDCDKDTASDLAAQHFLAARSDIETVQKNAEIAAKRSRAQAELESNLARERGIHLPDVSQKRTKNDDPTSEEFLGPWAPYEGEIERRDALRQISQDLHGNAAAEDSLIPKLSAQPVQKAEGDDATASADTVIEGGAPYDKVGAENKTFFFHAKDAAVDYQGRTWLEGPASLAAQKVLEDGACKLPTRCVHKFSGHTKGVNRIKWLPRTAHLILSGSMDGTCKIWSVEGSKRCLATYSAHNKAIRDISFTTDGRQFYSASFDTTIKLWDTEYGKVVTSFGNDKIPFCVSVHPDPSQQNVVVCACYNKKAVQYDASTGTIVQEYNEHLAIVNTATFCEGGKRLVTTSDDKKMFVWEFGIGVVVKHIAEPYMHAMPAVQLSPNGKYMACQSMDNQIVVYEGSGRFRLQSRKRFRGHSCTGYAILPGFSPNGNYLMSGDSSGRCWFWDWKTSKMYRHIEAHDGVCMSAIWHPYQSSLVATCGWDGLIKLWK